ncbi:DUF4133 domain-containing protein [Pedobacter sp. ASV1-7]|uniref:DUF4133 domain-containing protein n=1 Tax=Pedobacter sp. ASV1-7 TaxID=3145237 RepID=UPI0032E868ED
MMSSIYQINKGINKPIEFRGLYGQYIAYLAVGLVLLLLSFTLMYILGVPLVVVVPVVVFLGTALFLVVTRLSKRFGVHGLSKYFAKRGLPVYLKFSSRRVFTGLRVVQSNAERQRV